MMIQFQVLKLVSGRRALVEFVNDPDAKFFNVPTFRRFLP